MCICMISGYNSVCHNDLFLGVRTSQVRADEVSWT
jgi:hypothetical protein